jgi:hypothetical protein
VAGLKDRPRTGRPKNHARVEQELKYWVCRKPRDGKRRWTVRTLAELLRVPVSTMQDLLARMRLPRSRYQPWRRVRA